MRVVDRVVTNRDLEAKLDTSDDWIRERTGIRERRIAQAIVWMAEGKPRNWKYM